MPMTPTTIKTCRADIAAALALAEVPDASRDGLRLATREMARWAGVLLLALEAGAEREAGLVARLTAAQASLHGARATLANVGEGRE